MAVRLPPGFMPMLVYDEASFGRSSAAITHPCYRPPIFLALHDRLTADADRSRGESLSASRAECARLPDVA